MSRGLGYAVQGLGRRDAPSARSDAGKPWTAPHRVGGIKESQEIATERRNMKTKTYKLFRIYRVSAESKLQAWVLFSRAQDAGKLESLRDAEFVVEDRPKGFFAVITKQLLG